MSEEQIQRSIIAYLRAVLPPEAIVHSSENALRRGGRAGMMENARRKANGQVTGYPDLTILPYAHVGPAFLEVKTPTGRVSEAQRGLHDQLRALGYRVAVVRSVEDAENALREWGIGHLSIRGVVS